MISIFPKSFFGIFLWISAQFLIISYHAVNATFGYYRTYTAYGSGDTMISTFCAHGGPGPDHAWRKWNVECLDGEAVVGIQDSASDYQNLGTIWCKFMFPYKPPTNGIYPYYPNCFTKNMTVQFFCYTPRFHEASVNSFITGFHDNEFSFNIYRYGGDDVAPYKCCKAPTGYYIDYSSCYYMPTHDQYYEYYDTPTNYFLVACVTGYVMTGIAKKIVMNVDEDQWIDYNNFFPEYHLEWIQCCRMGFGAHSVIPPPPPITYDYYYPSNTSSYMGGTAKATGQWSGATARAFGDDGVFPAETDLQRLASTNGKIQAVVMGGAEK